MHMDNAHSHNDEPQAEYSVVVDIRQLSDAPTKISATAQERAALAKRFDIIDIEELSATIGYRHDDVAVIATCRLSADIVQQCVVSLEPFSTKITHDFSIVFQPVETVSDLPEQDAESGDDSFEIDSDDCDVMTYADGRFDIGEAVAQTLALELDPFPRGPNAEDVAKAHGLVTEVPKDNPFAMLEQLKPKG